MHNLRIRPTQRHAWHVLQAKYADLVTGVADGAIGFSGDAIAGMTVFGGADGSFIVTGEATANVIRTGRASGSVVLSGEGVGEAFESNLIQGAASGAVLSGIAIGGIGAKGAADGLVMLYGTATGSHSAHVDYDEITGVANGALVLAGSAAAGRGNTGEAEGAIRIAGVCYANFFELVTGTASGRIPFDGSASGFTPFDDQDFDFVYVRKTANRIEVRT